jgi:hypothetical protein
LPFDGEKKRAWRAPGTTCDLDKLGPEWQCQPHK